MATRDGSRERPEARVVKHQHSFSESGRLSVPMWDSSDPDRAPPPLPLNPSATNSPVVKPNTSTNIEKAAALIASRALENAPSAYVSNPPPSGSPERNLNKPQHKRMQSIQTGSVGRLSDSLERRSPDKGLSRAKIPNFDDHRSSRSYERNNERSESLSPTPRHTRPLTKENSPPQDNMLNLQSLRNRQETESPLADITNSISNSRSNLSMDSLSTQILNITSIATSLQREMSNLSRRSKDNANDLLSLKQATNTRDEDIRTSLRDLAATLDKQFTSIDSRILGAPEASRSTPNLGLFLDDDLQSTPTRKGFNLGRVTSPSLLDHQITASPSVVSVDGAASIALLEKVLREMATKDGQERIMSTLENVKAHAETKKSNIEIANSSPIIDPAMMKKLEEILVFMKDMKEGSGSTALVRASLNELGRSPSQLDMFLDRDIGSGQITKLHRERDQRPSDANGPQVEPATEEVNKVLKSIKHSMSQNGGLTNEVKALVRELRGEVMGMGRDIAMRLDQVVNAPRKSSNSDTSGASASQVAQIVDEGLAELKEHMHYIIQHSQQQNTNLERPSTDMREIVSAIENAIATAPRSQDDAVRHFPVQKEEMLTAIKQAWEECKPEISLEHFGLERDEILETLKEGLQSYQQHGEGGTEQISGFQEQILDAIHRGLAEFKPPELHTAPITTHDEISSTIKDCLDKYDFPISMTSSHLTGTSTELGREEVMEAVREVLSSHLTRSQQAGLTKSDMLDAVKEGMSAHSHVTKEIEFNREDLYDSIKACLEGDRNPMGVTGERIVETMHEFLASMKTEFQQYSAANGRDTEQVLDALKDGLEDLRADVEAYVDRAADVTGKDEIIDTVKAGFAAMQSDMASGFANRAHCAPTTPELLDVMEKEFEHLRETINKSTHRSADTSEKNEILDAIRDISDDRSSAASSNNDDIIRLVKDELEHMRTTLAGTFLKGSSSIEREDVLDAIREGLETGRPTQRGDGSESILSNTSELLDAFQEGVDNIRSDMRRLMDKPAEFGSAYDLLDGLKASVDAIRSDVESLSSTYANAGTSQTSRGNEVMLHGENNISNEIESLKVMITQLRIKVEALDHAPVPESIIPSEMRVHKDDLDEIHSAIRDVHESVKKEPKSAQSSNNASKEDIEAIETLLRNLKARVEDLITPSLASLAQKNQIDSVEVALRDIKATVEDSSQKSELITKENLTFIELLLKDMQASIEALQEGSPKTSDAEPALSKTDLEVLESICLETRDKLEGLAMPGVEKLASKDDMDEVMDTIKAVREQFEADNDLTAQAFEARKIEHGGLATKMDDVRNLIGEIREELLEKLNGSEEGIVELAKVLGMHHDNMNTYATASSISELSQLVAEAFESHMEHHKSCRSEMEERDATLFTKHEDMTAELKAHLEDKFNELMTKYDDTQSSNEAKLDALEDRDKAHLDATADVRSVVVELKSLMNTLGSTVSDTCERISTDSSTLYAKIEEGNERLGDLHVTVGTEHGITRQEIAKTVEAASRIEGTLHEHQPAILAAIQEVIGIVGQHFEHTRQQSDNFRTTTEEIKSSVNAIPSAIPPLLPAPETIRGMPESFEMPPPPEKYDDSHVRNQLEDLLVHAATAKAAYATMENYHSKTHEALSGLHKLETLEKLEKLDAIHEHVRNNAEELSTMIATQTRLMADHHASKAEEAREAGIALEKRTAQKELVEAEIAALIQEKNALATSMATLRQEHEELSSQTKRLGREVGKLETALNIRQAEMREMNTRAETLERRVLEGVMNHARSVRYTKTLPKKRTTAAERDASMNLKRVSSMASNATAKASTTGNGISTLGNTVSVALKKRQPLGSAPNSSAPRTSVIDRRILSLSNVASQRTSDVQRALVLAPAASSGPMSLKRSHSVKSNPSSFLSGRKPSWNGTESFLDKENHTIIGENEMNDDVSADDASDSGTERRTSYTGTYTDSLAYGTSSSVSRNSLRSTSYASSVGGTLNGHNDAIAEEDEAELSEEDEADNEDGDEFEDSHESNENRQALILVEPGRDGSPGVDTQMAALEALDEVGDLPQIEVLQQYEAKFTIPSDSGIGSEPPTPDVSNHGSQAWQSTVSNTL